MTKKRQASSIVNIMEEENMDILDIDSEKVFLFSSFLNFYI